MLWKQDQNVFCTVSEQADFDGRQWAAQILDHVLQDPLLQKQVQCKSLRLGYIDKNHPIQLELHQLCTELGLQLLHFAPGTPQIQLTRMLELAEVQALLSTNARSLPGIQCVQIPPPHGGHIDPASLKKKLQALEIKQDSDRILFSSGTTSTPKAIVRDRSADQFRIANMIEQFSLHDRQTHIIAGPLYHSGPMIFALTHLSMGSPLVILSQFQASKLSNCLEEVEHATLFLVPTHIHRLEQHTGSVEGTMRLLAHADRVWVAGSRFQAEKRLQYAQGLPNNTLYEFYGTTETGTIAIANQEDMITRPEAVGRILDRVEVELVDASSPGVGTAAIHSPMNARHSLGGDLRLSSTGAIITGDRVRISNGFLEISGRVDEMMISGGVNVSPEEVEDALNAHPQIATSLVFSIPDEDWGERICALVVPCESPPDAFEILEFGEGNPFKSGNKLSATAVRDWCKDTLSAAAQPKLYLQGPKIPCTATGKPSRLEARIIAEKLV